MFIRLLTWLGLSKLKYRWSKSYGIYLEKPGSKGQNRVTKKKHYPQIICKTKMLIPVTNEVLKACHSQHVVLCERQKLPIYDTLPWPKEKTKPKIHNNRVSLMSSQDNTRDTKPVSPIRLGTISTPIKHWLFNCRLTRPAAYPPHPPGTTNRGNNLLPICKYLRDYSRVPYGTSARLDPPEGPLS